MAELVHYPQVERPGAAFRHFVGKFYEAPETDYYHEYGGKDDAFLLPQ
jgi:hypothetical protein